MTHVKSHLKKTPQQFQFTLGKILYLGISSCVSEASREKWKQWTSSLFCEIRCTLSSADQYHSVALTVQQFSTCTTIRMTPFFQGGLFSAFDLIKLIWRSLYLQCSSNSENDVCLRSKAKKVLVHPHSLQTNTGTYRRRTKTISRYFL